MIYFWPVQYIENLLFASYVFLILLQEKLKSYLILCIVYFTALLEYYTFAQEYCRCTCLNFARMQMLL